MGRIAIASPSIPLALPSLYVSALSNAAGDIGSPHPCRTYGVARPAQRLGSTALGYRSLMRSQVQVLADPPTNQQVRASRPSRLGAPAVRGPHLVHVARYSASSAAL